ncbi:MAG: hypothetical protein K0S33_3201 [Bacteroidetes bacterium]|jgi:hypothetical protein|nr:hypothetical protein [Bacteroidota bacterium]
MSSKNNAQTAWSGSNLLTNTDFLSFIHIQVQYGVAQRGGIVLYTSNLSHLSRVASDVNLLEPKEIKTIIARLRDENFISKN